MDAEVKFMDPQVTLSHGAGGKASRRLVEGLMVPLLGSGELNRLEDAATVEVGRSEVVVTTDSFVVHPLSFPGGSLGELAVNGTVNDLAVSGAEPLVLTLAIILEAGLPVADLHREVAALALAAKVAGVEVVAGDTKVVEHGKADGIFMTTTGIGRLHPGADLGVQRAQPGDRILLSGAVGDHGITVMLERGELDLASETLRSDTRSVWPFVKALLDTFGPEVKWMRDPTRGGLATTLNEFAEAARMRVMMDESKIVVHAPVRGACEILGIDPFHIANEGQFVAIVSEAVAMEAEKLLRSMPGGEEAALIGTLEAAESGIVLCASPYGATRVIDMLTGDPLPRIC
ncbi:MAG: hydrogenase expression/formation protein HypE [Actinomycetota bacterium]|nr:hydrogenase expression/formation protein HypE [Actinomycetota bacterium]